MKLTSIKPNVSISGRLMVRVLIVSAIIFTVTFTIFLRMAANNMRQEAADNAAKAADLATENFNNLNNAVDDLSDKYDSLNKLTRGTKEWNAAVQDINNSVLDLIEEYPALSEFMKSKNGVLTLELDNEGV